MTEDVLRQDPITEQLRLRAVGPADVPYAALERLDWCEEKALRYSDSWPRATVGPDDDR